MRLVTGVVLAMAMVVSGCSLISGDEAAVEEIAVAQAPIPEPVFEPLDAPGSGAFYPLDTQLDDVAFERISLQRPAAAPPAPEDPGTGEAMRPSAEVLAEVRPTDDDVATGLYGGTAENTCDPERLISFLLANPDRGMAWATVQGISFGEIPDYIRSLTPRVLAEDLNVINHGFDERGWAIPIDTVLEAGTAVLVDADGQVRTRCYCGNPIVPKVPPYAPPRCLEHHALVYRSPGAADEEIVGVPRQVTSTGRTQIVAGVEFAEVAWIDGGEAQAGWVPTGDANARYCVRPPDERCSADEVIVYGRPSTDAAQRGVLHKARTVVLATTSDGWALIRFGGGSAWIEASGLSDADCHRPTMCISSFVDITSRPGSGTVLAAAGSGIRVAQTGATRLLDDRGWDEVEVFNPGPVGTGWVQIPYVSDDEACDPGHRCSNLDEDVPVYETSTSEFTIGGLWWARVDVLSGPTDGRWEISFAGGSGWVDQNGLRGVGCEPWVMCVDILGDIYETRPPADGMKTSGPGRYTVGITGHFFGGEAPMWVEVDAEDPVFTPAGVGWLNGLTGFNMLDAGECGPEPTPSPTAIVTPPPVEPPADTPPPGVTVTPTVTPCPTGFALPPDFFRPDGDAVVEIDPEALDDVEVEASAGDDEVENGLGVVGIVPVRASGGTSFAPALLGDADYIPDDRPCVTPTPNNPPQDPREPTATATVTPSPTVTSTPAPPPPPPANPCPPGSFDNGNNQCVTPTPTPTVFACPPGSFDNGNNQCVTPTPTPTVFACPPGSFDNGNNQCVTPTPTPTLTPIPACPAGTFLNSNGFCETEPTVTPTPTPSATPCPFGQAITHVGCNPPPQPPTVTPTPTLESIVVPPACSGGLVPDGNGGCICPPGTFPVAGGCGVLE